MPSFGDRSQSKLDGCHKDLQKLLNEAIKHVDFSVIEGRRSLKKQREAYADGRSTLDGVIKKSKHQANPSLAADLLPYPADMHGYNIWDDKIRFALFIGTIKGIALQMNIPLRVGMDWDNDGSTRNHKLVDYPHVEMDT